MTLSGIAPARNDKFSPTGAYGSERAGCPGDGVPEHGVRRRQRPASVLYLCTIMVNAVQSLTPYSACALVFGKRGRRKLIKL